MDTYRIVLFLHLLALLLMIGAIAVVGTSYFRVRAAETPQEALPWAIVAGQVGILLPVAVLGLFGSGAYLTSNAWSWSTSWIDASIVGLALVTLQGPLVAGSATRQLDHALRAHEPGPLDEDVRRLARAPSLWFIVCGNPAIVLAIVWIMTVKPGTAGATAAIGTGYAVGAIATALLTRQRRAAPGSE